MRSLTGRTFSGEEVSFSREAYLDAMSRYGIKDIEDVARSLERGKHIKPEVANFFRDFAIIQEVNHPDFDRAIAIGSLATRIELATGQVTVEELDHRGINHQPADFEFELIFS